MRAESAKRVWDAWDATKKIQRFTANLSGQPEFSESELIRAAVEREFEICGEALQHVREEREVLEAVPELERIIGLRNRLIHGYDTVDHEVLWSIIEHRVPELEAHLRVLLQTVGYPPGSDSSK